MPNLPDRDATLNAVLTKLQKPHELDSIETQLNDVKTKMVVLDSIPGILKRVELTENKIATLDSKQKEIVSEQRALRQLIEDRSSPKKDSTMNQQDELRSQLLERENRALQLQVSQLANTQGRQSGQLVISGFHLSSHQDLNLRLIAYAAIATFCNDVIVSDILSVKVLVARTSRSTVGQNGKPLRNGACEVKGNDGTASESDAHSQA